MSIQQVSRVAKFFDLLILHEEGMEVPFAESARRLFRTTDARLLDTQGALPDRCHLLVVCASPKTLASPSVRKKLSAIERLESLLLSPDPTHPELYKAALSIRSAGVTGIPRDEEAFAEAMLKIIPLLVKSHNDSLAQGYRRSISEHSGALFCIRRGGKTLYVNDLLKHHFGISQAGEFDRYIDATDIGALLEHAGVNQKIVSGVETPLEGEKSYFIHTHPLKNDETLITLIPLKDPLHSCEPPLLNRMNFIEHLKDAFVIHAGESEPIPIVMVHVENSGRIIEEQGENFYNDLYKGIVLRARDYFGAEAHIAQWHRDVCTILSEGFNTEELKETLERFSGEVNTHPSFGGIVPVLKGFVIDMQGVELNKAISIIDHIHQKELRNDDVKALMHYEVSSVQQVRNSREEALHYLEKAMLHKAPLKLLNFYKGIRITTPAKLVKLADGLAYVAIEKLQGYAMKLEGNTVLQSPGFPFDLQAKLKLVDVGKKIAVLAAFEPLSVSANNRRYIRIQSDHRMHVTLQAAKSVAAGTILDISIKSIACRISAAKTSPEVGMGVTLQFNLPLPKAEGGMVSMSVAGKIEYVQIGEEFTKVVVILDLEEPYESYLIEYIYNRQQALINEIKAIANKL